MVGLMLLGSAAATSLVLALATRRSNLVSTLLVAYVAYLANIGVVTLGLSPFRAVTRGGLTTAELGLLAGALTVWWLRGRPGVQLASARAAAREIVSDPVTALFLGVVIVFLGYEIALGSSPPNNMDSLTYHLSRAAAWAQHGGLHWIQNAPEVEMTAYQPFDEQQQLFLFVATGGGALYWLPQYLAELAILVSVFGASRRLGYGVRAAASATFLLSMFSVLALEASTAQNDLFLASLAAVASCLLLGRGLLEPALAGVAVSMGLGTKLTMGLAVPILFALAAVRGRRTLVAGIAGSVLGFLAIGMWGYWMNLHNTNHLLGLDTGYVQNRGFPSYPGSVANAFYLMYGLMDASILSSRFIHVLALAGLLLGLAAAGWTIRRAGLRRAAADGLSAGVPLLAPLLVIGAAGVLAYVARVWGFPIRGAGGLLPPVEEILNMEYGRIANEDYSAFGPVGIVMLLAALGIAVRAYVARRADARHLVLASALPIFLVLISLSSTWVPFLIRFFLVPAVLAAPLLAGLFRNRLATAATLAAAAISLGMTFAHDQPKPLLNPYGHGVPWNLTQLDALGTNSDGYVADALAAYDTLVPPKACVGTVLGPNEATYLLYGPHLEHRIIYLPTTVSLTDVLNRGLFYVVVSHHYDSVLDQFRTAGWRVAPLGGYWTLAYAPGSSGACAS
ncbi:MAG: glycosyltransferase 87 family protein [Actinomycetes bacterium]